MTNLFSSFLLIIFLTSFPFTVEAEITVDTALAKSKDLDTVLAKYYDLADQLGKEVRLYIKNYSTRRAKSETEDGFAYRVWYLVIEEGLNRVEEAKTKRHMCPAILQSP
jgi:hypothetical protein